MNKPFPVLSLNQHADPMLSPDDMADQVFARLAKALAHPTRVRILKFLLQQEACMCGQICDVLPLAQSTVSQHLKVLKEAGLITGEIDGPRVCYAPNPAALAHLKQLVAAL